MVQCQFVWNNNIQAAACWDVADINLNIVIPNKLTQQNKVYSHDLVCDLSKWCSVSLNLYHISLKCTSPNMSRTFHCMHSVESPTHIGRCFRHNIIFEPTQSYLLNEEGGGGGGGLLCCIKVHASCQCMRYTRVALHQSILLI